MEGRIRTQSRLDKGEVVGVSIQEVWLRDEHWGAIPEIRILRQVF